MYISFSVDSNTHSAAIRFLEQEDVFNVSITRAKMEQRIYLSINEESLKNASLLKSFISFYRRTDNELKQIQNDYHDSFAKEVATKLEQLGYTCHISYPMSGIMIDLVVIKNSKSLGVDLIGYPGDMEDVYSLDRYRMFRRANFTLFPLPYLNWLTNQKKCIKAIEQYFNPNQPNLSQI